MSGPGALDRLTLEELLLRVSAARAARAHKALPEEVRMRRELAEEARAVAADHLPTLKAAFPVPSFSEHVGKVPEFLKRSVSAWGEGMGLQLEVRREVEDSVLVTAAGSGVGASPS